MILEGLFAVICTILFAIFFFTFLKKQFTKLNPQMDEIYDSKDPDAIEMTYALKWAEFTIFRIQLCFYVLFFLQLIFVTAGIVSFKKIISANYSITVHLFFILLLILSIILGYTQSYLRYYEVARKTKRIANLVMRKFDNMWRMYKFWFTLSDQFNGLIMVLLLIIPVLYIILAHYIIALIFFPLPAMLMAVTDIILWRKLFYNKIKNQPGFKMYLD